MSKQIEALKLALEALIELTGWQSLAPGYVWDETQDAITALRRALEQAQRQQAIDKMAENERKLGIQMQPEPVAWRARDANGKWMYGDVPAPELPSGQPEFLGVIATPAAPVQVEHCIWARNGNTPCPHTAEKQEPVAWRARDANGKWMYGDVPAPELPSGQPEFLGVIATPAAPVQEPNCDRSACGDFSPGPCDNPGCPALRTPPAAPCNPAQDGVCEALGCGCEARPAVPLTDAQIGAVAADIWGSVLIAPQSHQAFARAIEAKLREKNGGNQ